MKSLSLLVTVYFISTSIFGQSFGNSIWMDGQTSYISIPDHSSLRLTTNITIEAWINPCITDGANSLVNKTWCSGDQNAFAFSVKDGKLQWAWDTDGCSNGSNIFSSNNNVIEPNTWQHVAVAHTPTSVTLYLNGQPIAGSLISGSFSGIQESNENLKIGAYKFSSGTIGNYFNGLIDEVRVWDFAVAPGVVLFNYNTELNGTESGLIAYYNMNTALGSGAGLTILNNAGSTSTALDGVTNGGASSPSIVSFNSYCSGLPNGVEEINMAVSVYPNPMNKKFFVEFTTVIPETTLEIYDLNGKLISRKSVYNVNLIDVDFNAPAGMYMIKLITENQSTVIPLVKVE